MARHAQYTLNVNNVPPTTKQKIQTLELRVIPREPTAALQGDAAELALNLAGAAIIAAERAGAPKDQTESLRRVLVWLRG